MEAQDIDGVILELVRKLKDDIFVDHTADLRLFAENGNPPGPESI